MNDILIIELGLLMILISILFYTLLSGWIETTQPRITKANFKLNVFNFLNLWIGYFISSHMFILIYAFIPFELYHHEIEEIAFKSSLSTIALFSVTLFVIYLGRIIAKFEGVSPSKAYFTTIFTFGLIKLIIDHRDAIISRLYTIVSLHDSFNQFRIAAMEFSLWGHSLILWLLIGSFLLASFGELILSTCSSLKNETYKSLMESFIYPSDTQILDSPEDAKDKLAEMLTKKNIYAVKCFISSSWLARVVSENRNIILINKNNMKIIILSPHIKKISLAKKIASKSSLDPLFNSKTKKISFSELYGNYISSINLLKDYSIKERNINNIQFIIAEYLNGNKSMILFLDNKDIFGYHGIYIYDPVYIEQYLNIFDRIWTTSKYEQAPSLRQSSLSEWRYR